MHFSRDIRNCAHPLVANCQDNLIEPAISAMTPEVNNNPCPALNSTNTMMFISNINDCQSYFLCIRDESVSFKCADDLQWNAEKQKCMDKTHANCKLHDD